MNNQKIIEYNYKIFIAGKERTFDYVELKINSSHPNKKQISAQEYLRIFSIVAEQILTEPDPMTDQEANFILSHYDIDDNDFQNYLQTNNSSLKLSEKIYPKPLKKSDSTLIKDYIVFKLLNYKNLEKKQSLRKTPSA